MGRVRGAALAGLLVIMAAACSAAPVPSVATSPAWSPRSATPSRTLPAGCAPVLILSARGTTESSNGGLLKPVAERIGAGVADARATDLPYPASWDADSTPAGVRLLTAAIEAAARDCRGQRVVLLGYSQGAIVVADTLSAHGARVSGDAVAELSPAASDAVAAVVLYGDPRFRGADPFNRGTFNPAVSGVWDPPRPLGALSRYASRIASFCVVDDFACQRGGTQAGHAAYFTNGMRETGADAALAILRAPR